LNCAGGGIKALPYPDYFSLEQKQLRHSDPRITLGLYAHVVGNQQRDAVGNRADRIVGFAAD
jgi:hypothetical protein